VKRAAAALVGVDIGSTTTSAVVAEARLAESGPSGRVTLSDVRERLRSPLCFTPFRDGAVDAGRVLELVDGWLAEAGVSAEALFGGGALITGLAARSPDAPALAERLRDRLGRALIATARDPRLESWLAFMGNVAELSRRHPAVPFLNVDIGGGTTNLALGAAGEVSRTGSLAIGARHVQVEPGTLRVVRLSAEARAIFGALSIAVRAGDDLEPRATGALLDVWVSALEAVVLGGTAALGSHPFGDLLVETPMELPAPGSGAGEARAAPVRVYSGGVGELVYRAARGEDLGWTPHGDLGALLAGRIVGSPVLGADVLRWAPEGGGRAVAYGLLRYATDLSGATVHLPRPDVLPLRDVPIVASLSPASTDADIEAAAALARGASMGGCLEITLPDGRAATVRAMAGRVARALGPAPLCAERPLVLLVSRNAGKVLGAYLTDWGRSPHRDGVIVLDEIGRPGACFLHIGRLHDGVVPVSFFGMR
jgi:ethanolamine utilization protein EutA